MAKSWSKWRLRAGVPAALSIFLTGASPVEWGAAPLEGLYVGNRLELQTNPLLDLFALNDQYVYFFSADGRVYLGLPRGGLLNGFDFESAEDLRPSQTGTWELEDGTITLRWSDARVVGPLTFRREGHRVRIGDVFYYRAWPGNGLRLEGTFVERAWSGGRAITFRPDGSFTSENFTHFAPAVEPVAFPITGTGTGTYRIAGYTLLLRYAGGAEARFTFFRYPQAEDAIIVVDGVVLLRE